VYFHSCFTPKYLPKNAQQLTRPSAYTPCAKTPLSLDYLQGEQIWGINSFRLKHKPECMAAHNEAPQCEYYGTSAVRKRNSRLPDCQLAWQKGIPWEPMKAQGNTQQLHPLTHPPAHTHSSGHEETHPSRSCLSLHHLHRLRLQRKLCPL